MQLDKVSFTAQVTERVWWKYPDINYFLKRPVSSVGKRVWLDDRSKSIKQTLSNLNKTHSLIYFFRGDCSVCAHFSPMLKTLSEDYNLNIRAVSVDGGKTTSFKDYKIDNGEAAVLGVSAVPDLFLYDLEAKSINRIATGFVARDELEERIYLSTQVKIGNDY